MPHRIKIAVTADKALAVIEVEAGADAPRQISLDQEQLLVLIRKLGQAHQEMVKGQEIPPLIGQRVDVVTDTRWAVGSEHIGEATLISFQHPAYGPVSFLVPIEQSERIAERMLRQVEEARAARMLAN